MVSLCQAVLQRCEPLDNPRSGLMWTLNLLCIFLARDLFFVTSTRFQAPETVQGDDGIITDVRIARNPVAFPRHQ